MNSDPDMLNRLIATVAAAQIQPTLTDPSAAPPVPPPIVAPILKPGATRTVPARNRPTVSTWTLGKPVSTIPKLSTNLPSFKTLVADPLKITDKYKGLDLDMNKLAVHYGSLAIANVQASQESEEIKTGLAVFFQIFKNELETTELELDYANFAMNSPKGKEIRKRLELAVQGELAVVDNTKMFSEAQFKVGEAEWKTSTSAPWGNLDINDPLLTAGLVVTSSYDVELSRRIGFYLLIMCVASQGQMTRNKLKKVLQGTGLENSIQYSDVAGL